MKVLNIIVIFLVTFAVAYIFGLAIVTVVDKKLDKISINLPKSIFENNGNGNHNNTMWNRDEWDDFGINLPRVVSNNNGNNLIEGFNNNSSDTKSSSKCDFQSGNIIVKNNSMDDNMYPNNPINYPNPLHMTEKDRKVFKQSYHPKMTVQDYKNWLKLYEDDGDINTLPDIHQKNYKKILLGVNVKPPLVQYDTLEEKIAYEKKTLTDAHQNYNLDCPFRTYDISKLEGANYSEYSEFR